MTEADYWNTLVSFPHHDPGALYAALAGNRLVPDRPAWHRQASCRGAGVAPFFRDNGTSSEADAFCATCPVAQPCLEYAIENDCAGRWAGTSEKQRRRMRRAGWAA